MHRLGAKIISGFVIFLFISIHLVFSQPWLVPGESNFYVQQKAFNNYWKDRKIEKGKGYKPFKRQEWFWEPRVYPTGNYPAPDHDYREWQRYISQQSNTHKKNPDIYGPMSGSQANWQPLGPITVPDYADIYPNGIGRLNCIRFHPTNPNTIYVGAPAGGFWRSSDGGQNWETTTDHLPTLGVSDIVVHPTNPNTIYIATGDRDASDTRGIGVLRSEDGGTTWQTTGLITQVQQSRVVNRLLLNPLNPNHLIAATNIGIYTTTDGGINWEYRFAGNVIDMETKPNDFNTVYAAAWYGNQSQVFRSTNGGVNWQQSSNFQGANRINIEVTKAGPNVVYALITNDQSGFKGLYRSNNNGENWNLRSDSPNILDYTVTGETEGGQGWYDLAFAVSPSNPDILIVGGINHWKSENGGQTWNIIAHWYGADEIFPVHADVHELQFSPFPPHPLYSCNDGGLYISKNVGQTWEDISDRIKITQFYRITHAATDPTFIIGGTQDNGTNRYRNGQWDFILGGDGMDCQIDYLDPQRVYASYQNGALMRSTDGGNNFEPMNVVNGSEDGGWVTPIVLHPQNPQIVYAGYENLWRSNSYGESWSRISDFGLTEKTIQYVAVSKPDPNVIYVAFYNQLFKTNTGGGTDWIEISAGLPLQAASITSVGTHPTNPQIAWVTLSGFAAGEKVYRTLNGGQSWENYSGSLPNLSTNCVLGYDDDLGSVYVGMDIGVFYRNDIINDWIPYNNGLPNVIVNDMDIHPITKKLRVGTYGRGIWESDIYTYPGFCAGTITLTAPVGVFHDGSNALNYSNNAECYWKIEPTNADKIILKFPNFITESGADYVKVYDGNTTNAPLLATLTGSNVPDSIISTGGALLIQFISDAQNTEQGWNAEYYTQLLPATCFGEQVYTTPTGSFGDGSGTAQYSNNLNCNFKIDVAGATGIVIKFTEMNLQGGSDFVYVYEGGVEWGWPVSTHTANWAYDSVIVTGQSALVKFITDFAVTAPGWHLTYYALFEPIYCGGPVVELTAPTGTFDDGSGNNYYANSSNCRWKIAPPGANTIALSFSAFNVEDSYDFVRVYKGIDANAPLIGEYSGASLPPLLIIDSPALFVQFTSDYIVRAPGFTAHYAVIDPNSFCDNTAYYWAVPDTFSDGSEPNMPYAPYTDCIYKIDIGEPIQLRFLVLETQEENDLVDIYEGLNLGGTLLGSYSGNQIPAPIVIPSGTALIHFTTDGENQQDGWVITYDKVNLSQTTYTGMNKIKAFPNPLRNYVYLEYPTLEDVSYLEITDITGKKILEQVLEKNSQSIRLDLSSISPGIYSYRILYQQIPLSIAQKLVIIRP